MSHFVVDQFILNENALFSINLMLTIDNYINKTHPIKYQKQNNFSFKFIPFTLILAISDK